MAAVRRSGKALVSWLAAGLVGASLYAGCPFGVSGAFSRSAGAGGRRGAGGSVCWVPGWPGVGAVWESAVARGARPWAGEGREGARGNRGNRALGGFPGFPGALQFPGPAGAARYWRPVPCIFPGYWRGGLLLSGEAGMGAPHSARTCGRCACMHSVRVVSLDCAGRGGPVPMNRGRCGELSSRAAQSGNKLDQDALSHTPQAPKPCFGAPPGASQYSRKIT
jgi:hypothetical protein